MFKSKQTKNMKFNILYHSLDIHHYLIFFWIIFHIFVSHEQEDLIEKKTNFLLAWAFAVSEYLIVTMSITFLLILIFHKYW